MIGMRTCITYLCTLGMILAVTGTTVSARGGDPCAERASNMQGAIRTATGKITYLRVHEPGSGYGPPNDFINVEVVIKLDSMPEEGFGFQLRPGPRYAANEAMLEIVLTAFEDGEPITIDYVYLNRLNSVILRAIIVPPEPVQLGYPMYIRLSERNGRLPLASITKPISGSPLDKKEAYR